MNQKELYNRIQKSLREGKGPTLPEDPFEGFRDKPVSLPALVQACAEMMHPRFKGTPYVPPVHRHSDGTHVCYCGQDRFEVIHAKHPKHDYCVGCREQWPCAEAGDAD